MLAPNMTGINNYIAVAIFIVASLTDLLDGKIARKYNLVTNFGKFMDPLADKLLVCSAMICLIQTGQLAAWIVVIIIAREFIISGFRLIASDNGVVIAASYWGKFKTVSQMFMIIVLIADLGGVFDIVGHSSDLAFTDPDCCIADRLYCKECTGVDTGRHVMIVRELEKQERKYALDIIWSVFCMDVAEVYEQEGIDTFREYLKQENIDQLCDNGELLMFGVFDQEELEGTISLQRRGHICNYYVRRSCQGKGAGRLLFDYAKRYCKEELHKTIMTVDAAPEAVKKYIHMGMKPIDEMQMKHGKCYVPMAMEIL